MKRTALIAEDEPLLAKAMAAQLHAAWAPEGDQRCTCPAIDRRSGQAAECCRRIASDWRPALESCADPALRMWATHAWQLITERIDGVAQSLQDWRGVLVRVQPCLCDPWHDHVLFDGDAVSGLIDYGSVKIDHVAVDLARMHGDLAGDDAPLRAAGLNTYETIRRLSDVEHRLLDVEYAQWQEAWHQTLAVNLLVYEFQDAQFPPERPRHSPKRT